MRRAIGLALGLATVVFAGRANAQGKGAACAARSDCAAAFRCVDNVCVDALAFHNAEARHDNWDDKGVLGYLGASFGLSLPAIWNSGGEAFQLAVRFGAIIDKTFQLELAVSPVSTVFTNVTSSAFGMFDVAASFGFLVPLNDIASWVVRFGGGGGAFVGAIDKAIPLGEVRLDFFGVSIRTSKHMRVEAQIPSFRILILTSDSNYYYPSVALMWVTNVSLDYVF